MAMAERAQLERMQAQLEQLRMEAQSRHSGLQQQLAQQEQLIRLLAGRVGLLEQHVDQRFDAFIGSFCGPGELRYDNPDLALIQQLNLCLLCRFREICEHSGIGYWLGFGTLIGAMRHRGFIPWDDDVDVCMTRDDYQRFAAAVADRSDVTLRTYHYMRWGRSQDLQRMVPLPRHRRLLFTGWPHDYFNFIDIYIYDAVAGTAAGDDEARRDLILRVISTQKELMAAFAAPPAACLLDQCAPPGFAPGICRIADADLQRRLDAAIDEAIRRFAGGREGQQPPDTALRTGGDALQDAAEALRRDIRVGIDAQAAAHCPDCSCTAPGADCLIYAVDNPCVISGTMIYERSAILPAVTLEFEGESFRVPRRSDDYLRAQYGNYRQLPSDVGVSHHFAGGGSGGGRLTLDARTRKEMHERLAAERDRDAAPWDGAGHQPP